MECPDPECKKTYKISVCAARHYNEKHLGNNSTYTCKHPGCPLIFISRSGANYHFQRQHGILSTQRFSCPEPRFALALRSHRGAQQHHRTQNTTLGPIDKQLPSDTLCNYSDCSQVFASRQTREAHYRLVHLEGNTVGCRLCTFRASSSCKKTMVLHLIRFDESIETILKRRTHLIC